MRLLRSDRTWLISNLEMYLSTPSESWGQGQGDSRHAGHERTREDTRTHRDTWAQSDTGTQ